jgi:hypothetical protein
MAGVVSLLYGNDAFMLNDSEIVPNPNNGAKHVGNRFG